MDKFFGVYKGLLSGLGKLVATFLVIGLVITAAIAGFGYGFAQCFGQNSCSDTARGAFVIFPMVVIVVAWWLYVRLKKYQQTKYKEDVRNEVVNEISGKSFSIAEQYQSTILDLLAVYGQLSIDELSLKSDIPKEEIVMLTRELLQSKQITQGYDQQSGGYFSLIKR